MFFHFAFLTLASDSSPDVSRYVVGPIRFALVRIFFTPALNQESARGW